MYENEINNQQQDPDQDQRENVATQDQDQKTEKKKKTAEERMDELDQRIHRLQMEKKRLKRKQDNEDRKKRDHAMILIGATLMTHYSDSQKEYLINADDETIKAWVHSLFKPREKAATTAAAQSAEREQNSQENQYDCREKQYGQV